MSQLLDKLQADIDMLQTFYCIYKGLFFFPGFSNTWSESKPFTVSVSVRIGGCDEYPDEGSDESCKYVNDWENPQELNMYIYQNKAIHKNSH